MKHIYLDKLFIFFLLIIIITGNFNNFFPYFFLLLIHEIGHAITGIILGYKLDKITLYPYGGVTSFNYPLNIPLNKELLILIMGPIFQIIAYFILKNYYDIKLYHYTLLIFNLLPIYPLDGGKILNIINGYFFNYLNSFYITFIISIIIILLLLIYNFIYFNLNLLLMILVIFKKLIITYQKRYLYYHKFILERYLYNYQFNKIKFINHKNNFYRDCLHYINYVNEKDYLKAIFKNLDI